MPSAPPDDRRVKGDGGHFFRGRPDPSPVGIRLDAATEPDLVPHLRSLEFPWVAAHQPVLGLFDLPAISNRLSEKAMLVANSISVGGDVQARHRLEKTGGQPPEAPIAERSVGLLSNDMIQILPQIRECSPRGIRQPKVTERILQQATDQKLHREIIDPLTALQVRAARCRDPPIDNVVAHHQRQGGIPILRHRMSGILADTVEEPLQNCRAQRLGIALAWHR